MVTYHWNISFLYPPNTIKWICLYEMRNTQCITICDIIWKQMLTGYKRIVKRINISKFINLLVFSFSFNKFQIDTQIFCSSPYSVTLYRIMLLDVFWKSCFCQCVCSYCVQVWLWKSSAMVVIWVCLLFTYQLSLIE